MKKLLIPIAGACALILGCQSNSASSPPSPPGSVSITVQPKTSGYYTSTSSGSNGPAFQLITISNSQKNAVQIKNISLTDPNSSITIATRAKPNHETDALYGNLPQCSTGNALGSVNELSPNQSCGILLQGVTYDPRNAAQKAQLNIEVSSQEGAGSDISKTFDLTNVTHVYASPNQNALGTESVPADKYILADCSNSSDQAGQPLTCTNALGTNTDNNFLSKQSGNINVFPNGNLILGGNLTQAGNFSAISPTAIVVLICKPGTDQCENALAAGTYFGEQVTPTGKDMGYVSKIELDPNTNNSTFFVTGKFEDIRNGSTVITSGTGASPNFVAHCTFGGSCTNIMPGFTVSSLSTADDNGIYGLAYNHITNTIYFAGTFKYFTDVASGDMNYPIVSCVLDAHYQVSSCENYFRNSSFNSTGAIYGLNFLGNPNEIQINGDSTSIAGQTTPQQGNSDRLSAICTQTGCTSSVSTNNGITARGTYDPHPQVDEHGNSENGLLYISGDYSSLGTANSNQQGRFLAACKRDNINDCFDVLGGGSNGAFNDGHYPTAAGSIGIVANVGAQLAIAPH